MWAIISTVVFDRKDCYNDAERDLLAIAKFLVKDSKVQYIFADAECAVCGY